MRKLKVATNATMGAITDYIKNVFSSSHGMRLQVFILNKKGT